MKTSIIALVCALLSGVTACGIGGPDDQPNVVLIVADDMGYSDLGAYGGEIDTPNLDQLAADGLRFLRFYNSAKCEPSRASMLSGRYWQDVGIALQQGPTIGHALQAAGYRTLAVGKWHLSGNPIDRGFDRFFGHLDGVTDYFKGGASHRLDAQYFAAPKAGFYTTDANADYAISFLNEAAKEHAEQPFFLYMAFNAPHGPLQAWPDDIAKYRGRYRDGWDALRKERYAKQLVLGIVNAKWELPPRPDTVPEWDVLSAKEKDIEDLRMATYAAMVDRMDQAIGRVVEHLRQTGKLDNTLILFQSDNGANPYDRRGERVASLDEAPRNLGLGWAQATGTPYRHYKRNMFHGGNNTPLIAHWPKIIKTAGTITDQPGHIIDLMATFVEIAGNEWPIAYNSEMTPALPGKSLLPIFAGAQREPHTALFFQLFDHRAVVAGDWKLVSDWGRPWQLFDLNDDRTETTDLAGSQRKRVEELSTAWDHWARKTPNTVLRDKGGEPTYRHLTAGEVGSIGEH